MCKVLIISNAHKGFLGSREIGNAIKQGILTRKPEWRISVQGIGDGGDGTLDTLVEALDGNYSEIEAVNPLNEKVTTKIGIIPQSHTGILEIVDLAGGAKVTKPWNTLTNSSYGLGVGLAEIAKLDVKEIIVCLGGSIISDGGAGMIQALGGKFLGPEGQELIPDGSSATFSCIDLPRIRGLNTVNIPEYILNKRYIVLSDVNIPLLGSNGQAHTFGPQKHATSEDIEFIENALTNWNSVLTYTYNQNYDMELSGAAGGLGAGLGAVLGAQLYLGINYVMDKIGFATLAESHDFIITGEGKLDRTTSLGKCCWGIAHRCIEMGKPYIGIFGRIEEVINEYLGHAIDASTYNLTHGDPPRVFSRQAIVDAATSITQIIESK